MAETQSAPSLREIVLPDVTALLQEGDAITPYAFASHLVRVDGPLAQAVASARAEGIREGLERAATYLTARANSAGDTEAYIIRPIARRILTLITAPPTTPGGRTDG